MSQSLRFSALYTLCGVLTIPLFAAGQTPMIGANDQRGANFLTSNGIVPVGCASCSNTPSLETPTPGIFHCRSCGGQGCALCDAGCGGCGENGCVPGRQPCVTCEGQSRIGRMFCAFHNAIACPDPCYEPRWVDGANASFFTDSARPWTMSRLRWDAGRRVQNPDRGEFLMAANGPGNKGFALPESRLKYDEFSFYQEFANGSFSLFVNTTYRSIQGDINGGTGGFGDLALGTKTMFLDSELVTATFQLQTFLPTGLANVGAGTGHVSIEPSILTTLKLCTDTYLQSQVGFRTPIGGTSAIASTVIIYRSSLNHVICRPLADTALIGTFETSGLTFTGGGFTQVGGGIGSATTNMLSIGPGLRLAVSNRVDAGVGFMFNVTADRLEENLVRTELRWRY